MSHHRRFSVPPGSSWEGGNPRLPADLAVRNACSASSLESSPSARLSNPRHPAQAEKLNQSSDPDRNIRRGAAVVEMAFIAPVLLLLVFGMIEYGRLIQVQQMLTNASREGARLAVVSSTTVSQVETKVKDYLTTCGLASSAVDALAITVNPNPLSGAASGSPVTVTVGAGFETVSWLPQPLYLSGRTVTASTVMRRESSTSG